MTHRRSSVPWFLVLLAAPACGGDDSSGDPDAPPGAIDAPPGTPDASTVSPQLVGTWREIPTTFDGEPPPPIEERAVLTLADDGTYTLVEADETETATFTADGQTMTITATEGAETHVLQLDYVATADRLMMGAIFPVGTTDGTVGTWHGEASIDGVPITIDVELRADDTARYARQRGTEPIEAYDGTWGYVGDDVVVTTMIDTTTVNIHFKEIRGVTIGGPFFERISAAKRATREVRRGSILHDVPFLRPIR